MKKKTTKNVVKKSTLPAKQLAAKKGKEFAHIGFENGADAFLVGNRKQIESLPKIQVLARMVGDLSKKFEQELQELSQIYGAQVSVTPVIHMTKLKE